MQAQVNLVPNPGFDEFDDCPVTGGNLASYVKDWYIVVATPDYFNVCSPTMGVPSNTLGYQVPRTGDGYMGAHIFATNNYIGVPLESFQVELKNKLIAGKKYCVSFFVNPSGASGYYIDCLDAYFSKTITIYPSNNIDGSLLAQVSNVQGRIITDTLGWAEITGDFIAEGGEQYLTLGCFKTLIGVDTIKNSAPLPPLTLDNGAYYFFEDISVFYCDEAMLDNIMVPNIFTPNRDGINDVLGLSFQGDSIQKEIHIIIYNRWGGVVYATEDALGKPWDGKTPLGSMVSTGVYYYVLYDEKKHKKRICSGFILKQEQMKKYIIYIFLVLCISIKNYAQWSTSLNPYTGTGLFLGTNNAYPLRVLTQNEDRMHINQNLSYSVNSQASIARNGYVGIGRNLTPTTIWNAPVK